jgi:hypothetical protein
VETLPRTDLERAYALAYFFHPEAELALRITARALAKLRLAERTQSRRRYYLPTGRRLLRGTPPLRLRTKVSLERQQLLQRLVLLECDAVERAEEQRGSAAAVGDDELALRFVRHLVRISSRRNSFYVATAVGRILHGYSTAAVLDLYATAVQHPDRIPDDSYLRRVKQTLVKDLKERFGESVRTRSGPRGEEVFETAELTPELRRLVVRSLELLTPWDTVCPVPAGFDPLKHPLRALRSLGRDPDLDHPTEVRRMHSLIHPQCFARLTQGLRLPDPEERLGVPRFFHGAGSGGGRPAGGDRLQPPPLSSDDLERAERERDAGEPRPAGPEPTELSVRVDGRERSRLSPRADSTARFELEGGSELLEVVGLDADRAIPLALHGIGLQPLFEAGGTLCEEIRVALGGGRELILTLTRDGSFEGTIGVRVVCRAASLASRVLARGQRLLRLDPWDRRGRLGWLPAFAFLAVVALALFVTRSRQPEPPRAAAPAARESAAGSTRGRPTQRPPLPLASVQRVLVEARSGPQAETVANLLRQSLGDGGRFVPTASSEAADAALKCKLDESGAVYRLELRLVDAQGRELWSATVADASWNAAVARAVADLTAAATAAGKAQGR